MGMLHVIRRSFAGSAGIALEVLVLQHQPCVEYRRIARPLVSLVRWYRLFARSLTPLAGRRTCCTSYHLRSLLTAAREKLAVE
jgi:hypothetical protein